MIKFIYSFYQIVVMYFERVLEEEWISKLLEIGVNPFKELAKLYINVLYLFSEKGKNEINFDQALNKAIELFEKRYGVKIKCTVEAVKALDVFRYIGGNRRRYPSGWDNIVNTYIHDTESLSLGKCINELEENVKFEEEGLIIA